jgi:uncharacterized protein YkwD
MKLAATTFAFLATATTASAGDACLAHVNAIRKQHGSPPYKLLDAAHQKCTAAEAKADAKSGKPHGSFTKCGEHGQGVGGGSCIEAIDGFMTEWPCTNCHASGVLSTDYHSMSYGQSGNHVTVNYYYCDQAQRKCPPIKTDFMADMLGANSTADRSDASVTRPNSSTPINSSSSNACLTRVNYYRQQHGLPPFSSNDGQNSCTKAQAAYDAVHGMHSAHISGTIVCGEWNQNECKINKDCTKCIDLYYKEGPSGPGDHSHYIAMMSNKTTSMSWGVATTSTNQNLWNQNFFK